MTPTSAGSQSKEKGFLDNYIEDLKKERIPEDGDRALRGEVGDDVSKDGPRRIEGVKWLTGRRQNA